MTHFENDGAEPGWEMLRRTERFVARRHSRPLLAVCAVVMVAGSVAVLAMAALEQRPATEWLAPALGFALFATVALLLLGQTYSFYEVGPEQIELKGWTGRRRRIAWDQVADIRATSSPTTGFSIRLADAHGQRIQVDAEVPDGRRLLGLVFGHLSGAGKDEALRAALARGGVAVSDAPTRPH